MSDRVRQLCMSLQGTTETSSWGHPNFRLAKRAYATLEMHEKRPSVAIRLEDQQVRQLCSEGLGFPTPHGRGQWVSLYVDKRPRWRLIESLIRQAHAMAARK